MIVKKITASFSIKKQIRQFEPIEVFMAAEAELEEIDDIDEAQDKLFEIVKEGAKRQLQKILDKGGEKNG